MQYRNSEMKLDALIGYFNDGKINLAPPFQRGHVWSLAARRRLIKNIVHGRPIPAIFLYKEAFGSKYTYNILDGKQRLESLLLFIGSQRQDVKINGVKGYFYTERDRSCLGFWVETDNGKKTFKALDEEVVRDFREYAIPTIEINLEDNSLDEVIDLFIDINQSGVKVNRFDIVKAMGENPLLKDVFDLIAIEQKRGKDMFYKKKQTAFSRVLNRLTSMQNMPNPNAKVDRMWERLLEIVLFCRTKKHRVPAQILKSFIHARNDEEKETITPVEMKQLKACFGFLAKCYRHPEIGKSRLATDQTHFYTMATSLIWSDLLLVKNGIAPDLKELERKLSAFAKIVDGKEKGPQSMRSAIADYKEKSQKQTTTHGQREGRQKRFLEIIAAL